MPWPLFTALWTQELWLNDNATLVPRRFVVTDLAAVNRTLTPWLIVGLHRMMYADSSDYRSNDDSDQTVAAQLRYAFEDLFYQFKVGWEGPP